MTRPARSRAAAFYLTLSAISLVGVIGADDRLPGTLAGPLAESGEALMLVVLLCVHIQFVRPRLPATGKGWVVSSVLAGCYLLVAFALHSAGFPDGVATLNEPWAAMAVLTLYFQLDRPVRRPAAYSVVALIGTIVLFDTAAVLDQAEAIGAIILAPIAFDIADPSILDRDATDRPVARAIWCALLAVSWLLLTVFAGDPEMGLTAPVDRTIDYLLRSDESLLGLLFVHIYFSYVLDSAWRRGNTGRHHPADKPAHATGRETLGQPLRPTDLA